MSGRITRMAKVLGSAALVFVGHFFMALMIAGFAVGSTGIHLSIAVSFAGVAPKGGDARHDQP